MYSFSRITFALCETILGAIKNLRPEGRGLSDGRPQQLSGLSCSDERHFGVSRWGHFIYGREELLGVVEILERDKFAGFLAVAGNDSSEIFGDRIASANVIITDENDLEFSIFQSDVFRDFWRVLNFRPTAIFAQIKAWEAATRDSVFSYRRRFGD
jgi:hypothetical protein